MKKIFAFILTISLMLSLAACGSSAQPDSTSEATTSETTTSPETTETSQVPSVEEASAADQSSADETAMEQVDMLYYLDLGDGSIMAAPYTQEGIDQLGQDYYVVHVDAAKIYNAAGEEISLEELTRGCPIRITWPGMVMSTYPGQINAEKVEALSDEADPSVPPEDEIEPFGDGPKWWVEEPPTEVPVLHVEYRTDMAAVVQIVEKRYGSWSFTEEAEDSDISGGASNTQLDGQTPWEWTYDDSNTITRKMDTLTLTFSTEAQTIQVTAYAYDDPQDPGTDVPVSEDGTIELLEGDHIYVISASWDTDQYQGEGTYGILVKEA